ncbi:hypothetical protein BH23ACT6_BH23ACT6_21640 [soil metagenome]
MEIYRDDAITVNAPAAAVLDVLLDAATLPEWNPALSGVHAPPGRASLDMEIPVGVQGLLMGTLIYKEAGPDTVSMTNPGSRPR